MTAGLDEPGGIDVGVGIEVETSSLNVQKNREGARFRIGWSLDFDKETIFCGGVFGRCVSCCEAEWPVLFIQIVSEHVNLCFSRRAC